MSALQTALRRIEATIDDVDAGGRADFDFHHAVVQASGSETPRALYESMSAC